MIRRLFTLVSVVSLLLCVAMLVSGVLSFGRGRSLTRYDASRETGGVVVCIASVSVHQGKLYFRTTWAANSWQAIHDENMGFQHGYEWNHFDPSAFRKPDFRILGFGGYRIATPGVGFDQSVRRGAVIPIWAVVFALAVIPWIGWRKARRRRLAFRQAHDLCPTCSYNLTGNTSGVCPECGTAVSGKSETTRLDMT